MKCPGHPDKQTGHRNLFRTQSLFPRSLPHHWPWHSEEDFVFVGEKNRPIEPRVFYDYYQEIMEQAGIEDANFHTLRHTFATRCIENGMDILMVAKTLGHSNVSTTLNKYSHLLPQHQKASMEKLEAIYF